MGVMGKPEFEFGALYRAVRKALGRTIEEPIPATLGYLDENGKPHLKFNTQEDIGRYYFTPLEGMPLDAGKGAAPTYGIALNTGQNPLETRFLVFGAPIYVRRDVISGEWIIAGLQPRRASEFFGGKEPQPNTPIKLTHFTPGLIIPTDPPSMSVLVLGAPYTLSGYFKYISTQTSINFTAQVPSASGEAKYASIEIDFQNESLVYQYGAVVDAGYTHEQAWYADNGSGLILPDVPRNRFRAGYVQLVSGMTAIEQENIFAVQEIYGKTDYTDILVACGEVVTADDEVVTV